MYHIRDLCGKCSHEITILEGKYDFYGYCPNCFDFVGVIKEVGNCCKQPEKVFVRHTISDGRFQLKKQCKNCATSEGRCYPHKTVENIHALIPSNYHRESINNEIRCDELEWMRASINAQKTHDLTIVEKNKEYENYKDYLRSPEWRRKRKLVLKRDLYICQACLVNSATEVHHITYEHVFNEFLFELVSVCRHCHENISSLDASLNHKKIVHTKIQEKMFNRNLAS